MGETLPNHVAIILDGNRRWAKAKGLPFWEGHKAGAENVRKIVNAAIDRQINYLTLFVWSEENWKRDPEEVKASFKVGSSFFEEFINEADAKNVRIQILGHPEKFPEPLRSQLIGGAERTKANTGMTLSLCASYAGRDEIIEACKKIINAGLAPSDITQESFANFLFQPDLPDPDLLIRTSGEQRVSGFLTWQSAYSELCFTDKYWPDFSPEDFNLALTDFAGRQRRYGT
jgi:undecaprenyl diphosphate synthase